LSFLGIHNAGLIMSEVNSFMHDTVISKCWLHNASFPSKCLQLYFLDIKGYPSSFFFACIHYTNECHGGKLHVKRRTDLENGMWYILLYLPVNYTQVMSQLFTEPHPLRTNNLLSIHSTLDRPVNFIWVNYDLSPFQAATIRSSVIQGQCLNIHNITWPKWRNLSISYKHRWSWTIPPCQRASSRQFRCHQRNCPLGLLRNRHRSFAARQSDSRVCSCLSRKPTCIKMAQVSLI